MNRRSFILNSAGLVLATAATRTLRAAAAAPNSKINLGIIGLGNRGTALLDLLVKMPDVEIACLCDVNRAAFTRATALVQDARGVVPKRVQDMREIFADQSVDAVVIATGLNWHALATIWACQAGKDVYVEKPMALTLAEGRKMVQAARKYGRVVQVGSQTESAPFFRDSLAYARSGKLGAARLGRTFIMEIANEPKVHPRPGQTAPVPAGLNWDMFCGPAPLLPYWPGTWWGEYWDFTLGGVMDHAAHQLSMIRQYLDLRAPKSVSAIGRIRQQAGEDRFWKEHNRRATVAGEPIGQVDPRRQTLDTCFATFECENQDVIFEGFRWAPYGRTPYHDIIRRDSPRRGDFPDWVRSSRVEICGSEAMLLCSRHAGGWQVFDRSDAPVAGALGRKDDTHHLRNFLDCMRTRARPNSDIEIAHWAMSFSHLMIASHRAGNVKLYFDAASETFTNNPEANKFLSRPGRGEFKIPDAV